jgi:hypothetical protein
MNDSVIIWVHGDCLSPYGPALMAHPGAPAIFVWDDELLRRSRISLKRIVFLYECLLELPVEIRRGDVAAEVLAFARAHGARRIITTQSPAPRFDAIRAQIEDELPVEALPVAPLVDYDGPFDLKRFSRYWSVAEPYAMGQRPLL